MPLHFLRNLCLFGLPLLLAAAALLHYHPFELPFAIPGWSNTFYTVALTANIGYFTNFIAIKMLFRPYHKTAFGRQGLIPKNQPRLAQALADTLSDHFLANEHWEEYLEQTHIGDKLVNTAQQYSENWLAKPDNGEKLVQGFATFLRSNESSIQPVFDSIIADLVPQLGEKIDPSLLLEKGFDWLEQQFEQNPRQMEFLIEPVVKTVAENVPMIADRIIETVDSHIKKQDTIRRSVAKAARWSANIKQEDVQDYLFRMVASPEFRSTLLQGLQSLVAKYKTAEVDIDGLSPGAYLNKLIQKIVKQQTAQFNLAVFIANELEKESNQQKIIQLLQQSQDQFFGWLRQQMGSPKITDEINKQLVSLIENLDLREIIQQKAAQFSPQKMESIFHNMISDQLVFIELLGAVLGALSGLALVDLASFGWLSLILASYFGLDFIVTHFTQKTPANESPLKDEND